VSRVALVFPYFRTRAATELLFPPLGLAALAAQLRRRGVETRVFDGTFSSAERLADDVSAFQPDIVGISAMVSLTANALRLAGELRSRHPDRLLVSGGPLPTVFPRRYTGHVDAVFRGEADLSFPQFCLDYVAAGASRDALGDLPLER
jgi:anaerobic magnesium-protoporphyrin IX monomethyl ester cyclase